MAFGVGLQPRFYVVGNFTRSGLYLVPDVSFLHASAVDDSTWVTSKLSNPGLTLGGVVGYRLVLRPGLTIDANLGAAGIVVDKRGGPESERGAKIAPLYDVAFGWVW